MKHTDPEENIQRREKTLIDKHSKTEDNISVIDVSFGSENYDGEPYLS
jgi:hypothetical protein